MNVQEMINALAEGENAKAKVPALEAQAIDLATKLDAAMQHSQALELKGESYRKTLERLNDLVDEVSKARDDAQFAALEAEDKLQSFRKLVDGNVNAILQGLVALDPKPVEVVNEPAQVEVKGESAADPIASTNGIVENSSPSVPSYPAETSNAASGTYTEPRDLSPLLPAVPATTSVPISVASSANATSPKPQNSYEEERKKDDWYDTNGNNHSGSRY